MEIKLLSQIVDIVMGQSPSSTTYNMEGNGIPFFQGKAEFGKLYPRINKFCHSPLKVANRDDILISVRAPVGPTNLAPEKCCIGRGLAALRAKTGLDQKYLLHFLRHIEPWLATQGTGSTFTAISRQDIADLEIPVPASIEEQVRISGQLDRIVDRLDEVKTRLATIPSLLKRFRQSILAAACSGRLTEDWRALARVQSCWPKVTLGSLANMVTSGSRGWAKYYSNSGPIFVRAQNINANRLILDEIAHVKVPATIEGARTRIKMNDLLITITGANVTKTAMVDIPLEEAYVSQHVGLVRLKEIKFAEYIYLWLSEGSPGRNQLLDAAYGVGKPGLNLDNLRNVEIDLPTIEEQNEIVRRVKELMSQADAIEARYNKAMAFVDKLMPSILAKAFRGELA